jgi:hypothetical protein
MLFHKTLQQQLLKAENKNDKKSPRGDFLLTSKENRSTVFFKQHINNMFTLKNFFWNKNRTFASQVIHARNILNGSYDFSGNRDNFYYFKKDLPIVMPAVVSLKKMIRSLPKEWKAFFDEHFYHGDTEDSLPVVKGKREITWTVRDYIWNPSYGSFAVEHSKNELELLGINHESLSEGEVSPFNEKCLNALKLFVVKKNEKSIIFKFEFYCSSTQPH